MKFEAVEIEMLVRCGDFLDGIDEVRERNEAGFNMLDKARWPLYRGHALMMARVLRKYRRQLVGQFGQAVNPILDRAPEHTTVAVERRNTKWGPSAYFKVVGKLDSDQFNSYRLLLKDKGCWFNGDSKEWYVPAQSMAGFDFKALFMSLVDRVKVEVAEIEPGEEIITVTTTNKSVRDIRNGIASRQIAKAITVIRLANQKIEFKYSFSESLNALFNNRSGLLSGVTEYNPDSKARETFDVKLALEAIEKIREQIQKDPALNGFELFVEDEDGLKREIQEREAENAVMDPAVRSVLAPAFSLFAYQTEMVKFLDKTNGCALIGDGTGLGKTIQALSWLAARGKTAVVVGPKVIRRNWINEAKKFFPTVYNDFNTAELSSKFSGSDLSQFKLVSLNYEGLPKFLEMLRACPKDVLICDESHKLKNEKTRNYALISQLAPLYPSRILMSGTAIKNKKEELFTQVEIVRPGTFSDRKQIRYTAIGKLWNDLSSTIYLARQKKDVLSQLPSKTTQQLQIAVPGLKPIPLPILFTEIARVKAEVATAKAHATIEAVRDILDTSDSSVLVFTDSMEAARTISEGLGEDAVLHHGQLSDAVREDLKSGWQSEKISARVFVTTRQSLSEGATMTRADRVVFNDLPWSVADVIQAEDRTHRVGQRNAVLVTWVVAADCAFDEKVSDIIRRKYELHKLVNEGKQVTPEERRWLEAEVTASEINGTGK